MDLLWSLGLIIVLLLAFNHMAGGRASTVLRPVTGIVSGVFSLTLRLCMGSWDGGPPLGRTPPPLG